MGIKKLIPFIKEKCPSAVFTILMSAFKGHRVAIDISWWLYSNIAIITQKQIKNTDIVTEEIDFNQVNKELKRILLNFVETWLNHGVIPVFIYDGESPPEKADTKMQRVEAKMVAKNEVGELKQLLENADVLDNNDSTIDQLRKAMIKAVSVPKSIVNDSKLLLESMGIPVIQAKGEAERLCSALCREGKVSAVYSADSDNIVHACPLLLTEIVGIHKSDDGSKSKYLTCIRHDLVLTGLGLSHAMFVDLCIMAGCDYNTNIYRIGIGIAYKHIIKYQRIEVILSQVGINEERSSVLKYQRCRELFYLKGSSELVDDSSDIKLAIVNKFESSREILRALGVAGEINRFVEIYEKLGVN